MEWSLHKIQIVEKSGKLVEEWTKMNISQLLPTWKTPTLNVPGLTLDYGLYRLQYLFQVETNVKNAPMIKTAHTYVNITKSDLTAILVTGSPVRLVRGWGQELLLEPGRLSIDPDFPKDHNFNFTWWCRVISPRQEYYDGLDSDGFPMSKREKGLPVRGKGRALVISPPPGCFGQGPGLLDMNDNAVNLNTARFITYGQVYELMVVISKDTRRAKVKIELDLTNLPVPVVSIRCAQEELCFPSYGGVFINPQLRLAVRGLCADSCTGTEIYQWNLYQTSGEELITVNFCAKCDIPNCHFFVFLDLL